jgi:hypothetical protein
VLRLVLVETCRKRGDEYRVLLPPGGKSAVLERFSVEASDPSYARLAGSTCIGCKCAVTCRSCDRRHQKGCLVLIDS